MSSFTSGPNLLLILFPRGYVAAPMRPTAIELAMLSFEACFHPDVNAEMVDDYVAYYDQILGEDGELVRRVQDGHRAGTMLRGPSSSTART